MSHQFEDADPSRFDAAEATEATKRFVQDVVSDPLLGGAIAAAGLSLGLQLAGRTKAAAFVGLWAPTLLLLGIYQRATADSAAAAMRRQAERDAHFEGGCATPPDELLGDGYLAAAREVDDYSEQITRALPHKAK